MSYAVMRMIKLKSNLRGIGKHIDRSFQGETISPQNANPEESHRNIHWDNLGNSYTQKEWTEYTRTNNLQKRVNDNIKKYRKEKNKQEFFQ